MASTENSSEQLKDASHWIETREADLKEAAFKAMEQGDEITQRVAESQLAFQRLILQAVEDTELR